MKQRRVTAPGVGILSVINAMIAPFYYKKLTSTLSFVVSILGFWEIGRLCEFILGDSFSVNDGFTVVPIHYSAENLTTNVAVSTIDNKRGFLNKRRKRKNGQLRNSSSFFAETHCEIYADDANEIIQVTSSSKVVLIRNTHPDIEYSVIASSPQNFIIPGLEIETRANPIGLLNRFYSLDLTFAADYTILVHEVVRRSSNDTSPGEIEEGTFLVSPSPFHFSVSNKDHKKKSVIERVTDAYKALLPYRRPPCQSIAYDDAIYASNLQGYWFGPNAVSSHQEEAMRSGWSFHPRHCSLETFSKADIKDYAFSSKDNNNATKITTVIAVLGTDAEHGVFSSLVDLSLTAEEKQRFKVPVADVGKCRGHANVQLGKIKYVYHDIGPKKDNCNNNADATIPVQITPGLYSKATKSILTNIFDAKKNMDEWPSVIFLFSGCSVEYSVGQYSPSSSCLLPLFELTSALPKKWNGTIYLSDKGFHGLTPLMTQLEYDGYRKVLQKRSELMIAHDKRFKWLDGFGISTAMRLSGKYPGLIHGSDQLHRSCQDTDNNDIQVCSNVTEAVAHLLLGRAIAPMGKAHTHWQWSSGNSNSSTASAQASDSKRFSSSISN